MKSKNNMERAVTAFLEGKINNKKFGHYCIVNNQLVYRTIVEQIYEKPFKIDISNPEHLNNINKLKQAAESGQIQITKIDNYEVKYNCVVQDTIAIRLPNGHVIGNSSVLPHIGMRMSFGHRVLNRNETSVQRYLSQHVPMIPFTVFEQAKLDINTFIMVDKGTEETVTRYRTKYDSKGRERKVKESVHFTGTSLFTVSGKTYLFDIDRREIKEGIFNPFLVEIPSKFTVKTIAAAYEALKPDKVKDALKRGIKVLRQGEWFFIPTKVKADMLKNTKVYGIDTDPNKPVYQRETMRLEAGQNSPNYAQKGFIYNNVAYVSGKVEHSGREHADLILNGWYVAIPNTAINSFTITGDID